MLLTIGGAYALASLDWCNPKNLDAPPEVKGAGVSADQLLVGAARVEVTPPLPIVMAGYPPSRPDASKAAHPLYARATVLEMGSLRIGFVSVDLLTLPEAIAQKIRDRLAPLGLSDVWIAVTHSHSSFGGYDPRLISELAGTGTYREAAELAVISAASQAVEDAAKSLKPATVEVGSGKFPELLEPRSDGTRPSGELARVVFRDPENAAIAQWIFFAAHPTNVKRGSTELDPDYPGFLSRGIEESGAGPALFFQLSVGNAGAGNAEGESLQRAEAMAKRVREKLDALAMEKLESPKMAFSRVSVTLPRTDSARLVPGFFQRPGNNFLCRSAPISADVSGFQLGKLRMISVPGEQTQSVGDAMQTASHAYAVALVNGYVGYVEEKELVESKGGESKRQYFDETLAERLEQGVSAAAQLLPKTP